MTALHSMVHPLKAEFSFAGFEFPKWLFSLPKGSKAKRLERAKNPVCGPYYHSPNPSQAGKGCGFYLGSDSSFELRWTFAPVNHRGWYCDEYGQGDVIRGIVFRLPRSRGFLAGWSMGNSMASELEYDIYETEREAALAADSLAETVAEKEREYQESEREKEREKEESKLRDSAEELELA